MTDFTQFDIMSLENLKNAYDRVPEEVKKLYNKPDWENDTIAVIRAKIIAIYKKLDESERK